MAQLLQLTLSALLLAAASQAAMDAQLITKNGTLVLLTDPNTKASAIVGSNHIMGLA